jgi:hypothetical protein
MERVSLLEILIWVTLSAQMSLGVKFYADNVTHIKISNKLTPSINYFLIWLRVDMFFQIIIIVCQLSKHLRYEYSRVSAAPGTLKAIVSLFFENLTRCPKVNCSNNLLLKFSKFLHMDQNIKRKVSPIQWNYRSFSRILSHILTWRPSFAL